MRRLVNQQHFEILHPFTLCHVTSRGSKQPTHRVIRNNLPTVPSVRGHRTENRRSRPFTLFSSTLIRLATRVGTLGFEPGSVRRQAAAQRTYQVLPLPKQSVCSRDGGDELCWAQRLQISRRAVPFQVTEQSRHSFTLGVSLMTGRVRQLPVRLDLHRSGQTILYSNAHTLLCAADCWSCTIGVQSSVCFCRFSAQCSFTHQVAVTFTRH